MLRSGKETAWKSAILVTVLVLLTITACASTQIIMIESPGCHKCAATYRALENVTSGKDVNITRYTFFSDEGHNISKKYKTKDVPSVIIGNKVINYRDYEDDYAKFERLASEALANQSASANASEYNASANNTSAESTSGSETPLNLSLISLSTAFTVFAAGFIAGFNPCLLAILVFLAASVMSSTGRRRDLIKLIVSFSAGIFVMYLLFGLGLQRIFQAGSAVDGFRLILTLFLLVLGALQITDAWLLHSGRRSMFSADWATKYYEMGVARRSAGSYFLIGALFSLVKAPCVGAVYLAILDAISGSSYAAGVVYLAVFNLGIILPIILLGWAITLGLSPEQVNRFRKDYRAAIRFATGLTLIALAPLIYFQII